MKTLNLLTAIFLFLACQRVWSDPATSGDADAAWAQLKQATNMPSWKKLSQSPSEEQIHEYVQKLTGAAKTAADCARSFYTQFPDSPHAQAAKIIQCQMLRTVFRQGGNSQSGFKDWVNALNTALADSKLTDDDRFEARMELAQSIRFDPEADGTTRHAQYGDALQQLIKDFPQRDKAYDMLLVYAAESSDDQARPIAEEVMIRPVSEAVKAKAEAILRRLDGVGKPLDIEFTAVDGREVDLSKMKGKVVLVDFWATWCGPCVGEIPNVKEAYAQYHSKGFEIVGISFDAEKQKLTQFVKEHNMPWPQYFDGKVWDNKFGQQFAIDSIPAMWLVDKNGNLYTERGRHDLAAQVEKLLKQN